MAKRSRKRKQVEQRSRQANWQHVQRQQGHCRRCGEPCDVNQRTKASYHHCPSCRPVVAAEMKSVMQRRRARLAA